MVQEAVLNLTKQLQEMTSLLQSIQEEKKALQNENALLKEEVEYLKKKLFGTKSETSRSLGFEQFSLFDEAEVECEPELLEEVSYKRRKKKYKDQIKLKLDKLPCKEMVIELADDDKVCPRCHTGMHKIGKEYLRTEVKFIPARLEAIKIYREVYECRSCKKEGASMIIKPGNPSPVIPHSYASAESVAYLLTQKYDLAIPFYRQEAEWKRLGLELSRATMANWTIIAANEYLIPLKKRLHEIMMKEQYVHCDETTVQVLNEAGKANTTKSYMWVYSNIKESKTPIRIFDYKPTRAGYNPREFLKDFKGYAITDGYAGYNDLENVTNVYCWAHARRKFVDSLPSKIDKSGTLATHAVNEIKKLFEIEAKIETLTPEEKVKVRQEKAKPILEKFFKWCANNQNLVSNGSKISKAINYAINHQVGLSEYINDGLLPMTNSLDERTIRPFTTGRKNWLFSASPKGADASAAIYSIIQTAKANGLDPYKYLTFIFTYLPSQDLINHPEAIDLFLPWKEQVIENCK